MRVWPFPRRRVAPGVPLDDLIITEDLLRRTIRQPNQTISAHGATSTSPITMSWTLHSSPATLVRSPSRMRVPSPPSPANRSEPW